MKISIIAIAAITLLSTIALLKGIDGALIASSISIIAGLGGFYLGRYTRKT